MARGTRHPERLHRCRQRTPDGVAEADSYEGADGRNGEPQVVGQQADGISGDPGSQCRAHRRWVAGPHRRCRPIFGSTASTSSPSARGVPRSVGRGRPFTLAQHRTECVSSIDHRGADIFQRRGRPRDRLSVRRDAAAELRSCAGGELRRSRPRFTNASRPSSEPRTRPPSTPVIGEMTGTIPPSGRGPIGHRARRSTAPHPRSRPADRSPHPRSSRTPPTHGRTPGQHPPAGMRCRGSPDNWSGSATEPSAEPIGQLADVAADRAPCRGRGEVVDHVDDIVPACTSDRSDESPRSPRLMRTSRPTLERFNVTLEVVGLRRCHPLSGTHVVDRGCVLIDRCSATLHEDRRRTHSIGAEQRCQRSLALRIAQPAETRLQLAGHLGDADEPPLRVRRSRGPAAPSHQRPRRTAAPDAAASS